MAFSLGHDALLFMLPFSVYALVFLRPPRGLHQTPYPILACAFTTPTALLAAADDVALAAVLAWTANVSAATSLWWCLTNGGYTAMAFSRVNQYTNFHGRGGADARDGVPHRVRCPRHHRGR
ncbi:hypothetical protein OsI_27761 [Oryza sativa Indica Group]|uniref:Uncharacterized protein n=1 Tax=Oryza sativa subsp. indica TaxID=39946 RepID=A2YR35_ORYSI|nr:hypothetical protein OsI_27761 [Oryza sativa Indica Group]